MPWNFMINAYTDIIYIYTHTRFLIGLRHHLLFEHLSSPTLIPWGADNNARNQAEQRYDAAKRTSMKIFLEKLQDLNCGRHIYSVCMFDLFWLAGLSASWHTGRSEPVQLVASLVQAVPVELVWHIEAFWPLRHGGADADWPGASGPWLRSAESTKGRGVSHRWG